MHPEIEKLIDLALADGQITEKERNIILKKAAELGVDADEVEMTLDGRLHQMQATQTKPNKEKVGNIKTCPACGASVKAFQIKCEDCGHEFQNTKIDGYLNEFRKIIESAIIDKESINKYTGNNIEHEILNETSKDKTIASLIMSYPLPKNKEDIIELLIYSYSNYESDDNNKLWGIGTPKPVKDAWYAKAKQALELLEVYGEVDNQSQNIIKRYRQYFSNKAIKDGTRQIIGHLVNPLANSQSQFINKSKNNKSGCLKYGLIAFVVLLIIGAVYTLIPLNDEDKRIKTEINSYLDQNKLDSAIIRLNKIDNFLEKKKAIDRTVNKAIEINDIKAAKKAINYYDSEYEKEESMKKIFKMESK